MISGDKMTNAESNVTAEEKRRAAERMRQMHARSKFQKETREPNTGGKECGKKETGGVSFLPPTGIPFLRNLGLDSDITLILGLLLILTAESSDKLLLLALLYILV